MEDRETWLLEREEGWKRRVRVLGTRYRTVMVIDVKVVLDLKLQGWQIGDGG